jgi:hypothetical protein
MRRQDSGDVGIPGENRSERVLGDDADLEIGTRLFQKLECRCRKNAVSERAQADDGNSRPAREALAYGGHR